MIEENSIASASPAKSTVATLSENEIDLVAGGAQQCKLQQGPNETPSQSLWHEAKFWWCVFTS